jgi:hypothetical protein
MPPPSVKPATPVVPMTPPVVASLCSWASRLKLLPCHPAFDNCAPLGGVDVNAFHQRQIDHQPIVYGRASGDVVTAAAHGDFEPARASEAHRICNVRHSQAPGDQRRPLIDKAVVNFSHIVIRRGTGLDKLAEECLGKFCHRFHLAFLPSRVRVVVASMLSSI